MLWDTSSLIFDEMRLLNWDWVTFPSFTEGCDLINETMGTHVSCISRGYLGVKPAFFMVLGSKGSQSNFLFIRVSHAKVSEDRTSTNMIIPYFYWGFTLLRRLILFVASFATFRPSVFPKPRDIAKSSVERMHLSEHTN